MKHSVRQTLLVGVILALQSVSFGYTTTSAPAGAATLPNCGPSGPTLPKPGGGSWVCTFDDEFDGADLDLTRWTRLTTEASGFRNGPECYVDSKNNVNVADGLLAVTVRHEASGFTCKSPQGPFLTEYTGGEATSWGKFNQAFGNFEIRAKFPTSRVQGLQSAPWLWPQRFGRYQTQIAAGELDIAEWYSNDPFRLVPTVHYLGETIDPNHTTTACVMSNPSEFHTYGLEWTATTLTFLYDGHVCLTDAWKPVLWAKPAPFDQPFFINLTQGLGVYGNAIQPGQTELSATTYVDYVRVWS